MKNSIHLVYGIIIGILICTSFGFTQKENFKEELTYFCRLGDVNEKIKSFKQKGYSIIELDTYSNDIGTGTWTVIHYGK